MRLRHKLPIALHVHVERQAEKTIKGLPLWPLLKTYLDRSASTGCSFSDYLVLYNYVREHKPREVLECGTGASSVVLAHALFENHRQYGIKGRVASMEEHRRYHETAVTLFPVELREYAEIFLSPAVEVTRDFFRGARYKEVPKRQYDFVFVDGPDFMTNPKFSPMAFDYDLVDVIAQSDTPVSAIVDTRTSTCFVYHLLFGDKFRYDYIRKLGFLEPCTKQDLLSARQIVDRAMRKHAFPRPRLLPYIRGLL